MTTITEQEELFRDINDLVRSMRSLGKKLNERSVASIVVHIRKSHKDGKGNEGYIKTLIIGLEVVTYALSHESFTTRQLTQDIESMHISSDNSLGPSSCGVVVVDGGRSYRLATRESGVKYNELASRLIERLQRLEGLRVAEYAS